MKSRQLGYVLILIIALGVAALIARLVSSGSDELVLSGLLPISPEVVDKVTIRSADGETEIVKVGEETWRIDVHAVFAPKLAQFWTAVDEIDGAQLVATNPANHERMGVAAGQGTEVSFFLGPAIQEQFIVGNWSERVSLCYLRRPGKDNVYGIACPVPASGIFDTDADGWRNRIVYRVPREVVEAVTFTYPGEQFQLRVVDGDWMLADDTGDQPADLDEVLRLLFVLENLPEADGFAEEEEAEGLTFDATTPSVRIQTVDDSGFPTSRLRFLRRDESSYYVRNPAQPTIYVLDAQVVDLLLLKKEDFLPETEEQP